MSAALLPGPYGCGGLSQENQSDLNVHRIGDIGHTIYKEYFCGSKTRLLPQKY